MDELDRTAVHEAGHAVVAAVLGWELRGVTAVAGRSLAGCALVRQPPWPVLTGDESPEFTLWPAPLREWLEARALVWLAGQAAEDVIWLPSAARPAARHGDSVTGQAEDRLPAVPAAEPGELAELAAAVDSDSPELDADHLARLARVAHGADLASAGAWLRFMEAQSRALAARHEARICRFARVLGEAGSLGAEAAARLA